MSRSSVVDHDTGYRLALRTIHGAGALEVHVGIRDDSEHATIAAANEYGVPGHIPARPLWRQVADAGADRYGELASEAVGRAVVGQGTLPAQLAGVGHEIRNDLIRGYASASLIPNAPATIARKGSSRPRVDTGAEQRAIGVQVVTKGADE